MATTETKIVEIKVPLGDALNQITALTAGINQLTDATKKLDKTNADEAKQIEINKLTIKDYQNQKRQLTNEVMKEVKVSNDAIGAYQKLQNEYSKAAAKAKDLAIEHGAGSKKATEAAAAAKLMNDRLKEADASVGLHVRNVGDYKIAMGQLPGVFGQMQSAATSAYAQINTSINSAKQMLADYIAAKQAEKIAQMEAAVAAELAAKAEEELIIAERAGTVTAEQTAAAEAARATATEAATVATTAGSNAMKIFKIALASTGIGLLLVALGSLVAYFTSTNDGAKKFQQVMNGVNAVIQSGVKVMGSLGKLIFDVLTGNVKELGKDWEMVKDNISGATTEIAKNYKAAEQNTKNQQMMTKREREWSLQKLKLEKEFNDAKIMAGKRSALDDAGKEKAAKRALEINELIFQNDLKIAKNKAQMVENEQKLVSKKDYQAIQDTKNKVQEIINAHSTQQLTVSNLLGKTEQRIEAANRAEVKSEKEKIQEINNLRIEQHRQDIQDGIDVLNERVKKYEQALAPKEKTLLDKVTENANAILNASIVKNTAIVAADDEATRKQLENAEKLKQKKIQTSFDYANAAADILQGSFDFTTALAETELQLWAEQNKGKANFDEEYAKKKAEIDHKQAVRNKIMQVVNSLINGAAAVVSLLATPPLAIAAGIAAALQTAAIIATPIPDKDATSVGGGSSKASSLPPDLTSKMAAPLGNSVSAIQSTGGSNAITSGAANVAMAKANEPAIYAPRVELSLVELKTKQRQVDFIDNVSTLSS